jgi:peptidoglycan/LPS O-acetylase OafA/YrhL
VHDGIQCVRRDIRRIYRALTTCRLSVPRVINLKHSTEASFETLTPSQGVPRFPALDGWRGISILLVLAGHVFPLGPKSLSMNASIAALGMAIFFTLSGFLITTTLLYRPSVVEFLIRRLCRIVPLAWLFTLVVLAFVHASFPVYIAHLFFFGNLPPFWLTGYTSHLWSLGVEMQFYLTIAAICLMFGRRGLWCIPFLCLLVTANRMLTHTLVSIVTSLRADEILVGGVLALACNTPHLPLIRKFLAWVNPLVLLPLAVLASNDLCGSIDYLRPYLVASMVGSTLFQSPRTAVARLLQSRILAYIAAISYALYILHPIVSWGWLASGSLLVKYSKRIPELAAVFALAHLSTFYFEHFWISAGKRWSKRLSRKARLDTASVA